MSDRTVARRYAQALYEQAEQQGQVEAIDEDVELIRESLDNSHQLVNFFSSPVIGRDKKENVIRELFAERVEKLTLRFLLLMVSKKREMLTQQVVSTYHTLRDEQRGVVEARARVAAELSEENRQKLKDKLESMTGKRVRLRVQHDPSLLGGLVVRIGDTVYDGSVQHHLQSLRTQLEEQVVEVGEEDTSGNGQAFSSSSST